MRIGIISDTHDHITHIREFVRIFQEKGIDLLIHAGDLCSPFSLEPFRALGKPVKIVFGNNDGDKDLIRRRAEDFAEVHDRPWRLEIGDQRVLLLHEPDFLDAFLHSGDFDLVIYGHTHTPETSRTGETRVINPGEGCGWLRGKASAVIYDQESDHVEWLYL